MGLTDASQVANALGYDEVADEERFEKWLDGGATLEEQRNPEDNNPKQQDQKTIKENNPDMANKDT